MNPVWGQDAPTAKAPAEPTAAAANAEAGKPTAEPAATAAAEPALPAASGSSAPMEPLSVPPPIGELFPENAPDDSRPPDFTQSVTMNLLKALVETGVLKESKAQELLQQAEKETLVARDTAAAAKAAQKAEEDDAMKVSYVPESVRKQIKDEVRNELAAEFKAGGTASLLHMPAPKDDIKFGGDLRLRYEHISYPAGNDNTGAFPNFNSINTGGPYDTAGVVFSPQYNVDQYRQRYRTRVRLSGEFELDDGWLAGIRIATGNDNSPTTTNQTIGAAGGGQGGGFSKYAIWLDRAFFRYMVENKKATATLWGGRFENPFQTTSIIFDEDLGFDGAAMKLKSNAFANFKPWITAGAFPIFNTDLNLASNQPTKFKSIDKFLYGAQVGADMKFGKTVTAKVGGAYFDFRNVEGRASTPYLPLSASDAGDTDHTRPSFAQRGNTYRPLRTIIPDPLNNFGTSNQFQYFGLASEFRPVTANAKVDFTVLEPMVISLVGEYIKNTAYNQEDIEAVAVNNRGPLAVDAATGKVGSIGAHEGSDTAWIVGIKFGHPALQKKGDWQFGVDYRSVGSDSVVDGFVDSEFGGGGTNVKGINLSGRVAISKNAYIGLTWMSADQIAGPPLKSDYVQLDFSIKF